MHARTVIDSDILGGVYMKDLVPVWKSYRYESRTGIMYTTPLDI